MWLRFDNSCSDSDQREADTNLGKQWVYWPVFCSQSVAWWACPHWGSSGLLLWWRLWVPSPSAAWWHSKAWTEAPRHTPRQGENTQRRVASSSTRKSIFLFHKFFHLNNYQRLEKSEKYQTIKNPGDYFLLRLHHSSHRASDCHLSGRV